MIDDPMHLSAQPAVPDPVAGKTVAEILGEIVWLMTQDPVGRDMKVSEIEKLVMPAILQKRFKINYVKSSGMLMNKGSDLLPVSVSIKKEINLEVDDGKPIGEIVFSSPHKIA